MKRNTICHGIVCLSVCLLSAPCLAQSTGMIGPELRQWIENPALGLSALREGRLADPPKPSAAKATAIPAAPAPVVSDKAVEITFVDPGMEAAARAAIARPTGPLYDTDFTMPFQLDAGSRGIQSVADLQYMPNLNSLYLQDNQISSLDGFPYLGMLSTLVLDSNQLVSLDGLPALPALQFLSANRNQIGTLADMPELPALVQLNLGRNQLVSLAGMPAFSRLSQLDLSYNRLAGVSDLSASDFLDTLDLSHNALQSLGGMPFYERLNTLDICYNQLATADGLYAQTPVYMLIAHHNRLTSLGPIGKLDKLSELDVSSNQLASLDSASFSIELVQLDVSGNRLSSLDGVGTYPGLRALDASHNCLKSLGGLAGVPHLGTLYLVGNGLASLADFPALQELRELDLSCNQLTTLADMGDTPALAVLEARFNQLQSLDPGFRPTLGYFGVSSNGLTSLATLNGANCPYMYMVDASFNQLSSLQGVENVPYLSAVAARGNQIGSLSALSRNPKLNWLDVSSNQLASFDDLPTNPPIAWLNASRNHITSLSGLAVAANLYLTRLDVSHNLLTSVAEIAGADKLFNLDLADNQVSDTTPLQGRRWQEIGLANNPTGDVQTVLFGSGTGPSIVSVGPGQLPSLAPFALYEGSYQVIGAEGTEYSDLSLLPTLHARQLRVSGAAGVNLAAWAKSMTLYGGYVQNLALPHNGLSDLAPLSSLEFAWLDVSGNNVTDIRPVTSGYHVLTEGIRHLNVSGNPLGSLPTVLGRNLRRMWFPPLGALIFFEYDLERFGMTPEEAHNCLTFAPFVDVTGTPVATAPEVEQLRAGGVRVRADGTCSYCQGACAPPVTAPNVAGMTQEAATAALTEAGLAAGTVTRQCSDTVPVGSVISQTPAAGATVDAGSGVALLVSLGPCTVPVAVPDVVGQTASDAVAAIQAAGLLVGSLTQQYSATAPPGSVISQNPAAGASAPPNTAVALMISLGATPGEGEAAGEGEGEGEPQTPLSGQAQALFNGFAAADANGDGRLSLVEAQAAQPGLSAEAFTLLDRNGDGLLSKGELAAHRGGPSEGGGCHGGRAGWGEGLGELFVLLLTLLGMGLIRDHTRP